MARPHALPPARRGRLAASALALGLGLGGCASVQPITAAVGERSSAEPPRVVAPQGPLSPIQIKAMYARLTLNAGEDALLRHHLAVEQAVAESPLFEGETTQLLRDGPASFRAMFAVIRAAKSQINLEYFILEDVESDGEHLGDLLAAKRAEGVEINVIYDSIGSSQTPAAFIARLRKAGVSVVEFNPVNPLKAKTTYSLNDRDHRKILVADGAVAIVGGVNLDTGYQVDVNGKSHDINGKPTDYLRDTDLELSGPVVAQLQRLFLEHWRDQHGPPLAARTWFPAIPAKGGEVVRIIGSTPAHAIPRYYVTLVSQIRSAERSVTVSAAFFVPTHDELTALKDAARRGVDVRLLLPDRAGSGSDLALAVGRSHYDGLLKAGVKLFVTHDIVLHAKTVTIDGVWSVIGSSNFDQRSIIFNDEVDAVVIGAVTAGGLEDLFRRDQQSAHPIDRATWSRRPMWSRVNEAYARVWQKFL